MATQPEPKARSSNLMWWAVGAIVVVVLIVVAGFAISPLYDNPGPQQPAVQSAQGLQPSDVASNATNYMGTPITMNGQVGEVISPEAVKISNVGTTSDPSMLVIGRPEVFGQGLQPGVGVQVNGTVGIFVRSEMEAQTGLTFDEQRFAEWEGKPVLVAQSITRAR